MIDLMYYNQIQQIMVLDAPKQQRTGVSSPGSAKPEGAQSTVVQQWMQRMRDYFQMQGHGQVLYGDSLIWAAKQ